MRVWWLAALLIAGACAKSKAPVAVDAGVVVAEPLDSVVDAGPPPVAPVARREPRSFDFHGKTLTDDYWWMKGKSPEVEAHLAKENEYAHALLAPLEPFQDVLYRELFSRVQEDDVSVEAPLRGYTYFSRDEAGKQYPIWCRKKRSTGEEQVMLDVNVLPGAEKYIGVSSVMVSPDDRLLAYATDITGYREYRLYVKEIEGNRLLPDQIANVVSFEWAADSKTLFYVTEDDAKRPSRLFRHLMGTNPSKDVLVYEEKDERFDVSISRTRSDVYMLMDLGSHTSSEVRMLPAKNPTGRWQTIVPRAKDIIYSVEHHGASWVMVINDTGRNSRVIEVPIANPSLARAKELVPHRADVGLDGVDVFDTFYVVQERVKGESSLRIVDWKTGTSTTIDPGVRGVTLSPGANLEPNPTVYRYEWESSVMPATTAEWDIKTRSSRVLKRDPVPHYDPEAYETTVLTAVAKDGTAIPISIASKKGVRGHGPAPVYMEAYGAYGINVDPEFSSSVISLLDRGVVFAICHPRGGGEYGKTWHDRGRMAQKMNTFTDFIACADHLVQAGETTSDRLVITGGSAGGLLMGAVLNLRPELFHAAVVEVPFLDVINTMLDETIPLTVGEFEEWGNPKVKDEGLVMLSYSPYDNLDDRPFPTVLVRSSYNDSQVPFHEPAKWVAKARALKPSTKPIMLLMEMEPAGHSGRSGRYDSLRDEAITLSFVAWQLGVAPIK